jgi:hypothetical protein
MNRREHQIVWIAPRRWQDEITVYGIYSHEGRLYGYANVGQVTWLVQQSTVSSSVWIIVGWVRTLPEQ